MAFDFAKLTTDVAAALQAGTDAANAVEDRGTCNLDGVVLRIPRIREDQVVSALKKAGLRHASKGNCGWHGIGYMINPISGGQADKRSVACEAIEKYLKEAGYNVSHYYQMD